MNKQQLLYSGKAKNVFLTDDPDVLIVEYRDDATAQNGAKKGSFEGKGIINNKISNIIFEVLNAKGIHTHFIKALSDRETLVQNVSILPLEIIVRNLAAGSFSKRYGVTEGSQLKTTILEFSYKNDDLGDPLINDYHAVALGLATWEQLDEIKKLALEVNKQLSEIFAAVGIRLVDFKIEAGLNNRGELCLADEISPDTCRLWDLETNKKLDKDRFRFDLGEFQEVYHEVLGRLTQ